MTKNTLYQILRLSEVLRLAYPDKAKHRIKSVLKPSAQSSSLCEVRNAHDSLIIQVEMILKKEQTEPVLLLAAIELMFLNGLRISEVLKIKGSDISKTGNIYINASKGSENRWVTAGRFRDWWLRQRNNSGEIFEVYSRFWFYRQFKRLGLSLDIQGHNNKAVTHSLRHVLVTTSQEQVKNLESSQRQIGHKSIKSTKHYDHR
jgi:site-specific recombinase XerD